MTARVDVLAALGSCRMETSQVARKCQVTNAVALCALRKAESEGKVEAYDTNDDGSYWRRGAARPLIWRARIGGDA